MRWLKHDGSRKCLGSHLFVLSSSGPIKLLESERCHPRLSGGAGNGQDRRWWEADRSILAQKGRPTFALPCRFPCPLQDVHGKVAGASAKSGRESGRHHLDELADDRELHWRHQQRRLHHPGTSLFPHGFSSRPSFLFAFKIQYFSIEMGHWKTRPEKNLLSLQFWTNMEVDQVRERLHKFQSFLQH